MSAATHAFQILEETGPKVLSTSIAIFGSDAFLRRKVIQSLVERCGVDGDAIRGFDGAECTWMAVHDELATISLFDAAHQRVAVVRDADKFVSNNRPALERWVEKAMKDSSLILELNSLPGNVKLHKLIAKHGTLIQCNPPTLSSWGNPVDEKALQKWLTQWAQKEHGLVLKANQVSMIMDRAGTELGLLDMELAKLSLFASTQGAVTDEKLRAVVGGWRTETVWEITEAVAEGKIGHAIDQLDRLMNAGQAAIGIMAPMAWSLRRFGIAAQLIEQAERCGHRPNLPQALEQAGFRKFDLSKAEAQLRRLGRPRARQLLDWLVELELKLKGSHSSEQAARFAIEEFVMRLA